MACRRCSAGGGAGGSCGLPVSAAVTGGAMSALFTSRQRVTRRSSEVSLYAHLLSDDAGD
jgi:hypothetical protein